MSESSSGKHRRLLVVPRDVSGVYPLPQRERTRRFALDAGLEDATPPSPRRRECTLLFVAPLLDARAETSAVTGAELGPDTHGTPDTLARDADAHVVDDDDIVDDDPTPREEGVQGVDVAALAGVRSRRAPSGEGTFVLPRARQRRARLELQEREVADAHARDQAHAHEQAQANDQAQAQQAQQAQQAHKHHGRRVQRDRASSVRHWHVAILVGAALVLIGTLLLPMGAATVDIAAHERTQRARARLELMELLDRDALAAAAAPSPLDEALARLATDDEEAQVGTRGERRQTSRVARAPAASRAADAAPADAAPPMHAVDPADGARVAPVAPVARRAAAPRTEGFARVLTAAGFGGSP